MPSCDVPRVDLVDERQTAIEKRSHISRYEIGVLTAPCFVEVPADDRVVRRAVESCGSHGEEITEERRPLVQIDTLAAIRAGVLRERPRDKIFDERPWICAIGCFA